MQVLKKQRLELIGSQMALIDASSVSYPATAFDTKRNMKEERHRSLSFSSHRIVHLQDKDPTEIEESVWQHFYNYQNSNKRCPIGFLDDGEDENGISCIG